uniref:hypothetical protein n=1 Tax=Lachnoclostridium phocaeense TaxID=1871021 RepID=UPI0026DD620F|nr:hypothetical protein [Lachnoclostridium phocaeense]
MRQNRRLLCALLAGSMLVSSAPLYVYADEQSTEINEDESVTITSPGEQGGTSNSNSSVSNDSSSGSSHNYTSAELNASEEKKAVINMLKDFMEQAKEDSRGTAYGSGSASNSLINIGIVEVSESSLAQLLNRLAAFNQLLGEDAVNELYNDQSWNMPTPSLPSDGSVDNLSMTEKDKIKEAIAEKEGLSISPALSFLMNLDGYGGRRFHITFDVDRSNPLSILQRLPAFQLTDVTGIRTDLIHGGLNDTTLWSNRFQALSRFTSNAMEDYSSLAYIKDYHINQVETDYVENIDYTSDERKWVVTNAATGEVLEERITDNPRHDFMFSGYGPGEYLVTAFQMADVTRGTFVRYDVCDYLIDAETGNILYFTERLVSNDSGGSILADARTNQEYMPTGDTFRIRVNDLGEVETDGSATERVE